MSGQKGEIVVYTKELETTPELLPNHEVFKIRIGQKLFEISGATLNSDAAQFLPDSSMRTIKIRFYLLIDRKTCSS